MSSATTTTFARLRSGDWGARCIGYVPAVGDEIHVAKRNGDVTRALVAAIVWQGETDDGEPSALVALDELAQARPQARTQGARRSSGRSTPTPPPARPQATPPRPAQQPPAVVGVTPETGAVVRAAAAYVDALEGAGPPGSLASTHEALLAAVRSWRAEVRATFEVLAPTPPAPALTPDAVIAADGSLAVEVARIERANAALLDTGLDGGPDEDFVF